MMSHRPGGWRGSWWPGLRAPPRPAVRFVPDVPGGMPLEKWFVAKFCASKPAFDIFFGEFDYIEGRPKPPTERLPPFLCPARGARAIQSQAFAVNAQYIKGFQNRRYIACEGPNKSSVYDFWDMVWQENVCTILMLNQPYEERLNPKLFSKDHETLQYWPVTPDETLTFAPWRLHCIWTKLKNRNGEDVDPPSVTDKWVSGADKWVYRVTRLTLSQSNPIQETEPREIVHICHYRWPDGQIPRPDPDYASSAMTLVRLMREQLAEIRGPIVVHCHAGVGRTGAAVALDIALSRLFTSGFADIRETVRRIREQRPRAVMNVHQYVLINLALAEAAVHAGLLPHSPSQLQPGLSALSCAQLLQNAWNALAEDFRNFWGLEQS